MLLCASREADDLQSLICDIFFMMREKRVLFRNTGRCIPGEKYIDNGDVVMN